MNGLDAELKAGFDRRYIAIVDVEEVDIPTLIKEETKVPVAPFNSDVTEFKHIQISKANSNFIFVVTDSTGHMTMLVKNLRLKARIYSDGAEITSVGMQGSQMMIMHKKDIAFSTLIDNKIANFYCEGSFTDEFEFRDFQIEKFRPNQSFLYALTMENDIVIFDYKYSGGKGNASNDKCSMLGRLEIPKEFKQDDIVAFAAIRGSLIF